MNKQGLASIQYLQQGQKQKVLKVWAWTPISKPLNGSLPRSNISHLLRLGEVSYTFTRGKEIKEATVPTYYIKGLKGAVRRSIMQLCHSAGLEICHTSDKREDKKGNSFLPEGFHLLGSCRGNGGCIVHQIFGSMGQKGLVSFYVPPIASVPHKTAKAKVEVQFVHIATENRHCRGFDDRTIQDFGERYFSGEFFFEIDVTLLSQEQVGLLLEAILRLRKLGRGFNSGYGRIKVLEFQLTEREVSIVPVLNGKKRFTVKEEIEELPLGEEVHSSLEAWKGYINDHTSSIR